MASAQRTEIMEASVENIYKVLCDYDSYSDYMDGVSNVGVIERNGNSVMAKYDINMIKKFSYVLKLDEVENKSVSWSFVEGDIFSHNDGSWILKDLGDGTTEVEYNVDVDIKVKMMGSGMIVKKLVNTSLPALMKSVEKRAQEL